MNPPKDSVLPVLPQNSTDLDGSEKSSEYEFNTIRVTDIETPYRGYETYRGKYLNCSIENFLDSKFAKKREGKVNLIITSPPFPLNNKKSYGNLQGDQYVSWLEALAPRLASLLAEDGSIVIEVGNAWNPDMPTMSTLPYESLIAFKKAAGLHLCQEFICHNPARLPSPVQYVNVERCRVKDSWTRIWWMAKIPRPKANNRKVLLPYSKAMERLLRTQKYNAGKRPSEHSIGLRSFLNNNGGSIPASCLTEDALESLLSNLLSISNTASSGDPYMNYCRMHKIPMHPARMQPALVAFFTSMLTDEGDLVFDPFGGSNTTGAVAHALGRSWVVTELSSQYMESSKARFEDRRRS